MQNIVSDPRLVAHCGLYCGACRAYRKGKCPGCAENRKAGWCQVRACCLATGGTTCAACAQFADVNDCRKFNNPIARVFAVVFNSNRKACIDRIREIGREAFAAEMAARRRQSLPRRR